MVEKERFEILLEEIKSGVRAAAEGCGVIRDEMKQMEERLTEKINKIGRTLEKHVRLPVHAGI